MISLKEIEQAKSINILTDNKSFANSSALYTHILRLHKKVSLVSLNDTLQVNLSCIPWFDKVRLTAGSSADLTIDLRLERGSLYELFKKENITINKKMATALYSDYLQRYNGFVSDDIDGIDFASISELIALGAEYRLCNNMIMKSLPLSLIRLKSILFKKMFLKENAKLAIFELSLNDLKSSGASLEDAQVVMHEALNITHVEKVVLLDADNENQLLKLI
ncbi:MAG: phosphoesterase [Sulfurimonas sp.]